MKVPLSFLIIAIALVTACGKTTNDVLPNWSLDEEKTYPDLYQKLEQDGLPYDDSYQAYIEAKPSTLKDNQGGDPIALARPKISFKWHGKFNPNKPFETGCNKPLGICIIISLLPENESITLAERLQGIGTATIIFQNDSQLKLIPDTYFSIDDKLEITSSIYFDNELANALGYETVEILNGIYQIDKSEGPFGSVIVNYEATRK